jgi:hypothetical protein
MVNVMERHPWQMKAPAVIVFAICVVGLLSFSHVDAARDGSVAPGSLTAGTIGKVDDLALKYDVLGQAPSVPPGSSTPSNLFRDIPSIGGDYSGARTQLTPYIGAGFGSGYASDLDRSLSDRPSTQIDSGSRGHFGQGLTPNEFQMGIRIPF